MELISLVILFLSLGIIIKMLIETYYILFTNRNINTMSFYTLLGFFKTKKILDLNKKYKYSKKDTKLSIVIIIIVSILFITIILHQNNYIDISFILNKIEAFNNWFDEITGIDKGFFEVFKRLVILIGIFFIIYFIVILFLIALKIIFKGKKSKN